MLLAGLALRYPARMPRTGAVVLACVPLVDVVLLAVTVADLRSGTTAGTRHGLAAAYIGFSVGYGHATIRWADARFRHRVMGGPPPAAAPKYGRERAAHEWRIFGRTLVAVAVSVVLLQGAVMLVGDASRTAALTAWQQRMGAVAGISLLIAASYTVFPKRPRADR
nr:hypothetical protein [Streptomyces sp. SID5468]